MRNWSVDSKFLALTLSCVILSIALLTVLIIRRESEMMRETKTEHAHVLVASINKALKDNMLKGNADDTLKLVQTLSQLENVKGIYVLKPSGEPAFGAKWNYELSSIKRERLQAGGELTYTEGDASYFLQPLPNEAACHKCHGAQDSIRGIVVVKLSVADINKNILLLIKRMSAFGILFSLFLSAALMIFIRRIFVRPITELTDAAKKITEGHYVPVLARDETCNEITGCERSDCPSFGDRAVPCWIRANTLCEGQPVRSYPGKLGECMKCRVYNKRHGDEIRQLIDTFNLMSVTLKEKNTNIKLHTAEIGSLNSELHETNERLNILLDASRVTSITLELEPVLEAAMQILLDVSGLDTGVSVLIEEDRTIRCHEHFSCDIRECPAYHSSVNCWRLPGTYCRSANAETNEPIPIGDYGIDNTHCRNSGIPCKSISMNDYDSKVRTCLNCSYFEIVSLRVEAVAGDGGEVSSMNLKMPGRNVVHRSLFTGETAVSENSENPFGLDVTPMTEIALPLSSYSQVFGVIYLSSSTRKRLNKEEIEFLNMLTDMISAGVFNSKMYEDVESSYLQTVLALSNAVEAKDPYTRGHSERVAEISVRIACKLGLSKQEVENLRFAALLHDIGKIAINRDVLVKPEMLAVGEACEMQSHPLKGVDILRPVAFLKPIIPSILHHHEKYDGTGYPGRLKGKQIPFKSRIISVADAWDAMCSDRPYRKALSMEAALSELRKYSGVQFDPEVVTAMEQAIEEQETSAMGCA